MSLFWQEYLYYLVSILAAIVSFSTAALFLYTTRREKKTRTVWRALGFFLLTVGFVLLIFERIWSGVSFVAGLVLLAGFYCIHKGVILELSLVGLTRAEENKTRTKKSGILDFGSFSNSWNSIVKNIKFLLTAAANDLIAKEKEEKRKGRFWATTNTWLVFLISAVIFTVTFFFFQPYTMSVLEALIVIFLSVTIYYQIKRYRSESGGSAKLKRQNLYPLYGYIFLVFRSLAVILYRLPQLKVIYAYNLTLDYGWTWNLALIFTFIGFALLAKWAWNFIKLRSFLRTYVVFLFLTIMVSSLGSLVFTLRIFGIVEQNNLNLMAQGASAESLIMEERMNNALFVAQTIADDPRFVKNQQVDANRELAKKYFSDSGVDFLRVYNTNGEILVSPGDEREVGTAVTDDKVVTFVLTQRQQVKTYDKQAGVLVPVLVVRSLYPVMQGDSVVGAIEVGYRLDTAFTDYSKEKTNLDVTIYIGDKRSATTILTTDGISRWVGSSETDQAVVANVLSEGKNYSATVDRLGVQYYSAFVPVRDINGEIIGMVSVGVPTYVLFESTRYQLVTTFLIGALISLVVAMLGYVAIRSFENRE